VKAVARLLNEMRASGDSWMIDVYELLARQAEWQRSRRALAWAEKIRMVEAIRGLGGRVSSRRAWNHHEESSD